MPSLFTQAMSKLDEVAFQSLYGRWDPLTPDAVARLLAQTTLRWYVGGGRAARAGAPARRHEDTDVVVSMEELEQLRSALADWDLWEVDAGTLRPLLPGLSLTENREQLWARLDAHHPWQLDVLLDRSGDEWIFKRDASIRLPWERALHCVDGVPHLRPELALLHKAHLDRPKDRADLQAAVLDPPARTWLVHTLDHLGHAEWSELVRQANEQ